MQEERRQKERIVAFVMAGGEGKRLMPLTKERCKPAVPFGGRYRLIDFVLSNLINSEIRAIYLLVQYKAQSLIEHIRKAWTISPLLPDQFVTVVPPQMHADSQRFAGTADAVYQSLNLLSIHRPDIVAVFGADHVYRMDVRQMLRFHRQRQAEATVAALPVPITESTNFGVIDTDDHGRVRSFQEKPQHPQPIPGDSRHVYASMGNYLFNTDVLIQALEKAHERGETDFGHQVLPQLVRQRRIYAYNFNENEVPGIKPYEQPNYWRDVGNLDTYFESHKDVLGIESRFDAFNPQWPIFSSHYQGPVALAFHSYIDNCLLGAAVVVDNAKIKNTIARREVLIEPDVELEDCIIMDYVRIGKGSKLRRVIVDRHNYIEPNTVIGYDLDADRRRYHITNGGVVVVPKGKPSYYARNSRGSGIGYQE
ncbi:MAG: glucose-1-phosphate adenylyltransferase [Gammaproteobacteria bacterium]|jgi:glucose-1-phosphate adenylyltransferase